MLIPGQCLQPADRQLDVDRYVPPGEFDSHQAKAKGLGFGGPAAGPLVRSSHLAGSLWH